jgi:hypothetical protein
MQASIRQKKITDIWKHNGMIYRILGGVVLVSIGDIIGGKRISE